MRIDTKKLRELVAAVNFSSEAHGESRWYGEGGGTIIRIDRDGVGMADFDLVAHLSPATVEKIADHIDDQADEIAEARGQIEYLDKQNNAMREALRPIAEIDISQETPNDFAWFVLRARAALSGEGK